MATTELTQQQLLIGGTWTGASSGATYEQAFPFTGEQVGAAAAANRDDARAAVAAAHEAFGSWSRSAPAERRAILNKAPAIAPSSTRRATASRACGSCKHKSSSRHRRSRYRNRTTRGHEAVPDSYTRASMKAGPGPSVPEAPARRQRQGRSAPVRTRSSLQPRRAG